MKIMTRREMLAALVASVAVIATGAAKPEEVSGFQTKLDTFLAAPDAPNVDFILVSPRLESLVMSWKGFAGSSTRRRYAPVAGTYFSGTYKGIKVFTSRYQSDAELLIGYKNEHASAEG